MCGSSCHKVTTTPKEYAKQLMRVMRRHPDMTLLELAEKIGKTEEWVERKLLYDLDGSLDRLEDEMIGLLV